MDAASDIACRGRTLTPRLRRFLRGGLLYVTLTRAEGLAGARGVTKTFRIEVKIGPRDGRPVFQKTVQRTGIGRHLDSRNPVFDGSVEFLVDGDLAVADDTLIGIELWTSFVVLRPKFNGSVVVPLAQVLQQKRISNWWPLVGGSGGKMRVEFEWLATLS